MEIAMENQPEEKKTQPPGSAPAPAEQGLPDEEPIVLKELFPSSAQDLDALFPDPGMKKLLKEVARTRQKNERFLKKIRLDELPPEEKDEDPDPPKGA
jgi:hypothetical protein